MTIVTAGAGTVSMNLFVVCFKDQGRDRPEFFVSTDREGLVQIR